jgi:hypothetical protein
VWDRPTTFIQSQDLPWLAVPDGEFGAGGGLRRVLSVDTAATALTALVQVHARQRNALMDGADLYVLQGTGAVNGRRYGPGHFLTVPPGASIDLAPATPPTTVFVSTFGRRPHQGRTPPGPVLHLDTEELPWSRPEWGGPDAAPDGAVKWLRRDERGIVFLSTKLPGWRSPREERHPHAEESFRINGDFFAGRPGVLTAGGYFFHRPGHWHGPLYSRTGTTALIRADAEIRTEYREPTTGVDTIQAYLSVPHPALSRTSLPEQHEGHDHNEPTTIEEPA